jgi:chromosome segregation ATPase
MKIKEHICYINRGALGESVISDPMAVSEDAFVTVVSNIPDVRRFFPEMRVTLYMLARLAYTDPSANRALELDYFAFDRAINELVTRDSPKLEDQIQSPELMEVVQAAAAQYRRLAEEARTMPDSKLQEELAKVRQRLETVTRETTEELETKRSELNVANKTLNNLQNEYKTTKAMLETCQSNLAVQQTEKETLQLKIMKAESDRASTEDWSVQLTELRNANVRK